MKPEHETMRLKLRLPFEDTEMAKFLARRIDELSPHKSQREIAADAGYDKPNILSMFKRGETKVPLDKVPALARALNVDPAHLFRLALEQQMPEVAKIIGDIFGNTVSANEFEIVEAIRKVSKNTDPKATATQLHQIYEFLSLDEA
jgi:transcriptional regulator with XRE-family HTH domain